MAQTSLRVTLLSITPEALRVIYVAARQCYSAEYAGDMFESPPDSRTMKSFIKRIVDSGHESPLEHVQLTFSIEGVSRALTHQLVRHRIASFSQQSQRYVKEDDFNYIIPPTIAKDETACAIFTDLMTSIQKQYSLLRENLVSRGIEGENATQDVRFVLPQATETKIVVTMNIRELLHFFELRCCTRAQWEIRFMAEEMLRRAREQLPEIFSDAGAKCVRLGYCPEGPRFCCGRYPVKSEAL